MTDQAKSAVQGEAHHGVGHILPVWLLAVVFGSLVLLTVLTVGVSVLDLGSWALYAAMAVALVKATLVALYFMHLRYDKPFNLIVFVGCLAFATLFVSLALTDSVAYQSSKDVGQSSGMKGVHTPFGTQK